MRHSKPRAASLALPRVALGNPGITGQIFGLAASPAEVIKHASLPVRKLEPSCCLFSTPRGSLGYKPGLLYFRRGCCLHRTQRHPTCGEQACVPMVFCLCRALFVVRRLWVVPARKVVPQTFAGCSRGRLSHGRSPYHFSCCDKR